MLPYQEWEHPISIHEPPPYKALLILDDLFKFPNSSIGDDISTSFYSPLAGRVTSNVPEDETITTLMKKIPHKSKSLKTTGSEHAVKMQRRIQHLQEEIQNIPAGDPHIAKFVIAYVILALTIPKDIEVYAFLHPRVEELKEQLLDKVHQINPETRTNYITNAVINRDYPCTIQLVKLGCNLSSSYYEKRDGILYSLFKKVLENFSNAKSLDEGYCWLYCAIEYMEQLHSKPRRIKRKFIHANKDLLVNFLLHENLSKPHLLDTIHALLGILSEQQNRDEMIMILSHSPQTAPILEELSHAKMIPVDVKEMIWFFAMFERNSSHLEDCINLFKGPNMEIMEFYNRYTRGREVFLDTIRTLRTLRENDFITENFYDVYHGKIQTKLHSLLHAFEENLPLKALKAAEALFERYAVPVPEIVDRGSIEYEMALLLGDRDVGEFFGFDELISCLKEGETERFLEIADGYEKALLKAYLGVYKKTNNTLYNIADPGSCFSYRRLLSSPEYAAFSDLRIVMADIPDRVPYWMKTIYKVMDPRVERLRHHMQILHSNTYLNLPEEGAPVGWLEQVHELREYQKKWMKNENEALCLQTVSEIEAMMLKCCEPDPQLSILNSSDIEEFKHILLSDLSWGQKQNRAQSLTDKLIKRAQLKIRELAQESDEVSWDGLTYADWCLEQAKGIDHILSEYSSKIQALEDLLYQPDPSWHEVEEGLSRALEIEGDLHKVLSTLTTSKKKVNEHLLFLEGVCRLQAGMIQLLQKEAAKSQDSYVLPEKVALNFGTKVNEAEALLQVYQKINYVEKKAREKIEQLQLVTEKPLEERKESDWGILQKLYHKIDSTKKSSAI